MLGGAIAGGQLDRVSIRASSGLRKWMVAGRWTKQSVSRHPHGRRATLTVESQGERAASLLAQSSSTAMFSCSIRLDLLVVAYGRLFRSVLKLIVTRGAEP